MTESNRPLSCLAFLGAVAIIACNMLFDLPSVLIGLATVDKTASWWRSGLHQLFIGLEEASNATAGQPLSFDWSGLPIGLATGCYLLSHVTTQNKSRIIAAVAVTALLACFLWGTLAITAFLIALALSEAWLADDTTKRISRLGASGLFLYIMHRDVIAGFSPYLNKMESVQIITMALVITAVVGDVLSCRRQAKTITDPLLAAFLSTVVFSYGLTVVLFSGNVSYLEAVLATATLFCLLLTIAIFLTTPITIGKAMSAATVQHMLSLRIPLKEWTLLMSSVASAEESTAGFMTAVAGKFVDLPGIVGIRWQCYSNESQLLGQPSRHATDLHSPPLRIKLYTRRHTSPWQWFNYHLLLYISAEYYLAKRREEQQRIDNLSRSVHEIGARLTHDIKNILHTLTVLTTSADESLLRRQLSVLRERLHSTLHKLQAPGQAEDEENNPTDVTLWWQEVQNRHQHNDVIFHGQTRHNVPANLFDLALDHFIENARCKRESQPDILITVTLVDDAHGHAMLSVSDTGDAIDDEVVRLLFQQPVTSLRGFGVGLYQVATEARKQNYHAFIADNRQGFVRFCVAPSTPPEKR